LDHNAIHIGRFFDHGGETAFGAVARLRGEPDSVALLGLEISLRARLRIDANAGLSISAFLTAEWDVAEKPVPSNPTPLQQKG
jgi:hypothetical protein